MALVKKFSKISAFGMRQFSSTGAEHYIKKSVYISQSKDIFTNLAIEDWLYQNFDFKNHHILMLWQNDPCVVIGRHQNPWLEANVPELPNITEYGVKLARRNSGGGTVYHDNGNLNMTFFTPRERYSLKYNLEIICRSLFRNYNLNLKISPRNDLTLANYKVSGTASKLGRPNAYHHCSLLVNAKKPDLQLALKKTELDIKTNATRSVRSKILNLCEEKPDLDISSGLMESVGWEYLRTNPMELKDEGIEYANQQNGFQMINPTEDWFPGLNAIRDQYSGWDWCFGKTPKFDITKSFEIPNGLLNESGESGEVKITLTVEKGKITDIIICMPPSMDTAGLTTEGTVLSELIGQKFSEHALYTLEELLSTMKSDTDRFVTECLKQVMISA